MNIIESLELVVNEVNEGKILRRKIRNLIFRLRSNRVFDKYEKDRAPGIKMIFEPQFREVNFGNGNNEKMSWENFTFLWDVDPKFPLKLVTSSEWIHAGGKYTKEGFCNPTAFTHQKA
jgi:hypothetical protein